MKNDLKKKFLDILFEPEGEEVVEDAPIDEVRPTKKVNKEKPATTKTTSVPKASDVLYGGEKLSNTSFINYKETSTPKNASPVHDYKEEKVADLSDTYELKRHISPIFGETESKTIKKDETVRKPSVTSAPIGKSDYTGVVISPIFGYDNASADKARTDFMKNKKRDSAMLRQEVKPAEAKNITVEELYDEPISLFEEPFDSEIKKEDKDEPFTSEIKVIDVEGEPIEEVKEEDDEPIKQYEVKDLDSLDDYKREIEQNIASLDDDKDYSSENAKSFIDDLLGDKD